MAKKSKDPEGDRDIATRVGEWQAQWARHVVEGYIGAGSALLHRGMVDAAVVVHGEICERFATRLGDAPGFPDFDRAVHAALDGTETNEQCDESEPLL